MDKELEFEMAESTLEKINDSFSIDFHNEFELKEVAIQDSSLTLIFSHIEDEREIAIRCFYATLVSAKIDLRALKDEDRYEDLYIGRFEDPNNAGALSETDSLGRHYYYLDFESRSRLEFFASKIIVSSSWDVS